MLPLELLAPARTLEIGIAAIDCGADAVYIAGPAFGARLAAGNSVEDIAKLCAYAHRFGARIFVTLNTILYEEELAEARRLIGALTAAGADGLIVQDLAVPQLAGPDCPLRLHASTQCAIRTPERLGATRRWASPGSCSSGDCPSPRCVPSARRFRANWNSSSTEPFAYATAGSATCPRP